MDFRVKFFFADAQTIEETFPPSTTVADAKNKLIASWPEGREPIKSIDELKMIYAGKLLDNAKSFAELKIPTVTQVIMHLQPTPPSAKVQVAPPPPKPAEQSRCCAIL